MSAARVLKELDEVGEALNGLARTGGRDRRVPAPAGRAFVQAHPLLSGALLGGGVVGLVAALVLWAQADATPDPEAQEAAEQQAGADFRGQSPLGPEMARRAEELRRQIAEEPENLELQRALTQLLLSNERPFDAFQQAQQMLAIDPEDPDGHYVTGVVRYMMGQVDPALEELGRALRSDPGHEQAALMRGLMLMQLGDRNGALATWEDANGVRASSRLEQLIAMTRDGRRLDEILGNPF